MLVLIVCTFLEILIGKTQNQFDGFTNKLKSLRVT